MSEIKINEVKHTLSNVVGHTTTLHNRMNLLAIKLNIALKRISELERTLDIDNEDADLVKKTIEKISSTINVSK
tara:strand:+ start:986 stop:1207 length:222 start_codon:yes stop_codon:yes gene_type:complete